MRTAITRLDSKNRQVRVLMMETLAMTMRTIAESDQFARKTGLGGITPGRPAPCVLPCVAALAPKFTRP